MADPEAMEPSAPRATAGASWYKARGGRTVRRAPAGPAAPGTHKVNATDAPILIVPYVWIGDFVRVHSVVRLLHARAPERPVDMLASPLCAPLVDYMPGVRRAVIAELPRGRLGLARHLRLARELKAAHYAQAIVMSRKWKAALAPWLAGIPRRTGFVGELRFGLINDLRLGERRLPRMIERMIALALPEGATVPRDVPPPALAVPREEVARWRARRGLEGDARPIVALCPGAVGEGKAWPPGHYASLARDLTRQGASVWVLGGPNETAIAGGIRDVAGGGARDLTGADLREAILALAAADLAVTNDSGLMHVSAALGTPTVAIFGPTSPWHWKPLNPLAAILEPPGEAALRERARIHGNAAVRHRRTADVTVEAVRSAVWEIAARGR